MFVALGLFGFGIIYLAYNVTNLLIPVDLDVQSRYHAWRGNKAKLATLFDSKTLKRVRFHKSISLILIIVFLFGFGTLYFSWFNKWSDNEIATNYVERRVVVKSISWAKGRYADFEFTFNNKVFSNRTKDSNLQIGDSLTIYFSSKNPKILKVKNYN
jgi:hypothetical protein